jgi:hypothetical protein
MDEEHEQIAHLATGASEPQRLPPLGFPPSGPPQYPDGASPQGGVQPQLGAPQPPYQHYPQMYAPQPIYVTQQVQIASPYAGGPRKSVGVALLLAFLFGPLGLFYASVTGGIVMLIVSVVLALMTYGISILLTLPICMIWAAVAANNHNARLVASVPYAQIVR